LVLGFGKLGMDVYKRSEEDLRDNAKDSWQRLKELNYFSLLYWLALFVACGNSRSQNALPPKRAGR